MNPLFSPSIQQQHQQHHLIGNPWRTIIQGFGSGLAKLIVGHPMDSVKVRVQVDGGLGRFKGPFDCLMSTIKNEGFMALYKGSSPYVFGWSFVDAGMVSSYEFAKRALLPKGIVCKKGESPEHYLSLDKVIFSGFCGGMVASLMVNPIDLLKSRLQVQYTTSSDKNHLKLRHLISKIYTTEGIGGFYRAYSATVLYRSFISIYFGSFVLYKRVLCGDPYPGVERNPNAPFSYLYSGIQNFLCGGLAATTFWCFSFPSDLIKNRLFTSAAQSQSQQSILSIAKNVYSNFGFRGFYQGFVPCLLRAFPANGAAFLAIEFLRNNIP